MKTLATTKQYVSWYDYAAEKYVDLRRPEDDATARRFIPQMPAAQGLYTVRRLQGDDILDAMRAVLVACSVGGRE